MILQLDDVRAGYGRTTVLHGLTLDVPAGGLVAILGHNGAGKSTLLRTAVGLLRPTHGRVLLDGEDVSRERPHRRVRAGLAYVPQGQQSFGQLTTRENLLLVADAVPGGRQAMSEAIDRFPALVELMGRRAGLLSGGQRQQLALARALITRPRLLLLDEPTEGIQPSVVAEIERTIHQLVADGLAVLLAEQRVDFAAGAATTFHVLESGRVTVSGEGGEEARARARSALSV